MTQRRWLKLLLAAALLAASGCGAGQGAKQGAESGVPSAPGAAAGGQSGGQTAAGEKRTVYPLTVKDATGAELTFTKAPSRIVSTSPAETETLYALGLGDVIVGVSDFDDFPAEAGLKPKVGGVSKPNAEAILAAGSDLVVTGVSLNDPAVIKQLRDELKLPLFKTDAKTYDDVIRNVRLLGTITDRQTQAEQVVGQMESVRSKVLETVKDIKPEERKRVFMEFSPNWTVGKGTFLNELLEMSGAVNIAADVSGWAQMNEEKVIQDNPDVILFGGGLVDDKTNKPLEEAIKGRSGWSGIEAVKNGRLYALDKNMMSRPGPRLGQALLDTARAVYPERFQ
ncbi:ABC transporter substrate-binding protein [Paenibacillus sp. y28]|uniref:ABC transporter substrate-binding protein n=1 Tax=Paenibacillus sp. y28 TaxID=3129110 RepID=UPI003015C659